MPTTDDECGIRVAYSNRIERLAAALADELEATRSLDRIFDPPRVIVPNRNVEKYLKFDFSDRFGVLGDVAFSTLEAWLRDHLPDDREPLDEDRLSSAILGLLLDGGWGDDETMGPVRAYLDRDAAGERAVRAHQLATRLARNFLEYGHSRVEMLERWRGGDGLYTDDPQYRRTERWQRALWRELFADGGALDRGTDSDVEPTVLTEYWRQFDPDDGGDFPDRAFLFGLSHVAPVYGQIFERLSRSVELRFFILNPCREYWEHVVYDREEEVVEARREASNDGVREHLEQVDRRTPPPDPEPVQPRLELDAEGPSEGPLPLSLWGRAGRDHVHMLNQLKSRGGHSWVDPVDQPIDDDSPSLLETFQSDVLNFVAAADSERDPAADGSVRFVEASGLRRELEAIADDIWRLALEDGVDFDDIAVVLNPRRREEYQMHLEAVFEEVRGIPFNQVDVERGDGSRLLEAAERLMELPLGEFDRQQLGSLLVHPNVVANYEEADAEEWERWIDELGIFRGADADDHGETHVDRDLYNWDQGITRLVLGAFLESRSRSGRHTEPFELDEQTYLPRAPDQLVDVDAAGRWIELVRRLIGQAEMTRRREATLGEWLDWIADWMDEHLAPVVSGEEAELNGYLDTLRSAADADLSAGVCESVPYRAAVEHARSALASQTYERGHYLATGVVVSSFVPQRPIPFEAIYITGMSADAFPASSPRTPIDLRTARWHEGDVWDRDRERYMFFETLLSARRRVTCSWVASDPVTGETVEPSSVVREFQHVLGEYVGEEGLDELVRRHPLRRFDPSYFEKGRPEPTVHPAARDEYRALALRQRLLETSGADSTRRLDPRRAAEQLGSEGDRLFGLVDLPACAESEDEPARPDSRVVPFRAVRTFLETPLQGWARYRLGLREDDAESILQETDEPFELSHLDESRILREAFETTVHETADAELAPLMRALSDQFTRAILQARAPTGLYSRTSRGDLRGVADQWAAQLRSAAPDAPGRWRLGEPAGRESIESVASLPVTIECGGERRRIELIGDTALVDAADPMIFIATRRRARSLGWRYALRGWVQGLVLSAKGLLEGDRLTVALLSSDGDEPTTVTFDDTAPGPAREHLERVLEDLWFQPHGYRFAVSELSDVVAEDGSVDPEELQTAVYDADESDWGGSSDRYGPVDNIQRYEIPSTDPQRLAALVERRLGPFVDAVLDSPLT